MTGRLPPAADECDAKHAEAEQRDTGRLRNGIDLCVATHRAKTGWIREHDRDPERIRAGSGAAAELPHSNTH